MTDKNLILENLTTEDVIDIVEQIGGTDYIEKDKEIIFRTFCHHCDEKDGSYKLYYYKKDKKFMCYTCCGSFDIFGLICQRYETLGKDYNFYKDVLQLVANKVEIKTYNDSSFLTPYYSFTEKYKQNITNVTIPEINPYLLNIFHFIPVPNWLEDGISEESMRIYGIRYSIDENKIIIPHYDSKGRLVGIRGRTLNKEEEELYGKYMPVYINNHMYSHPLGFNLYGLNLIQGNIKRIGMAIVAEGEKSVLQYDTMFGHENNICVATCGSTLHDYQVNLLIKAGAKKILLAYDKEGENYQAETKYYEKLENICKRFRNKIQIGYIRDMENLLKLKDSPMDRGSETFLKLYWKNTIWL